MKSSLRVISSLVIAALVASVSTVVAKTTGKCHGLALASGKGNGPYQAGAIIAMLE